MEPRSGKLAFGICLVLGAAVAIWFGFLLITPSPGSLEEAFSQVRVGMSQEEAVAPFKICTVGIDSVHFSGFTKDGRKFFKYGYADIPPPWEIDYCEFYIGDDFGNEAEVFFGPSGTVTDKRYTSSDSPGERLLIKVRHALDHKIIHKAIGHRALKALGLW
jgi:hypothetical protein